MKFQWLPNYSPLRFSGFSDVCIRSKPLELIARRPSADQKPLESGAGPVCGRPKNHWKKTKPLESKTTGIDSKPEKPLELIQWFQWKTTGKNNPGFFSRFKPRKKIFFLGLIKSKNQSNLEKKSNLEKHPNLENIIS